MICRNCKGKSKKVHSTGLLPESIWPLNRENYSSKCHVYACTNCYHLQLQNFSKKKISKFYGDIQSNISKSKTHNSRIELIKNYYGLNSLRNKRILDIGGGINPILSGKNIYIADFKIQKTAC